MKRLSLLLLALGFTSAVFAGPVDVNTAKELGQKFVHNTLGKKSADLSLAYTPGVAQPCLEIQKDYQRP